MKSQNKKALRLFNGTFQLGIEIDGGTVGMKEAPTS